MGPDQVLVITPPNSITFEGTFKEVVSKKIILMNPLDKNVAFKIKTTTPKQYCVRPNIGCIGPEETKEISIMLQPLQYTFSDKAKHKFMIQSMIISEEDIANMDSVWKNAPATAIMCSKLLSVLIQTNEIAQPKESHEETINQTTDDMVSFNDSHDHLPDETNGKEMQESGDVMTHEGTEMSSLALTEVLEENGKLKEQVATLKKMVFDNTYKWESLQADLPHPRETDRSGDGGYAEAGVVKEGVALPVIVYQLIAFFLGLIIGKFLL